MSSLTVVLLALRLPYLKSCPPSSGHERLIPTSEKTNRQCNVSIYLRKTSLRCVQTKLQWKRTLESITSLFKWLLVNQFLIAYYIGKYLVHLASLHIDHLINKMHKKCFHRWVVHFQVYCICNTSNIRFRTYHVIIWLKSLFHKPSPFCLRASGDHLWQPFSLPFPIFGRRQ